MQRENQLDKRVKVVRSDGGADFGSGINGSLEAKAYWADKGILHTVVPAGNHAQNGRVERPHLTILQSVQTLLIDTAFQGTFWAEYNRVPISANIVPLNRFTDKCSALTLFKPFGGLCWFRDNDNTSKILPRYKEGKFLNHEGSDTTYKIWDVTGGKGRLVRDVVAARLDLQEQEQ